MTEINRKSHKSNQLMNKYAFFDVDNTIYDGYSTSGFYLFLVDKGTCDKTIRVKDKELNEFYYSGKIGL